MSHKKLSVGARRAETAAWQAKQRAEREAALRIKREQDRVLNAGVINQGLYPVQLQTLNDEFDALTRARAYSMVVEGHAPASKPPFLRIVR